MNSRFSKTQYTSYNSNDNRSRGNPFQEARKAVESSSKYETNNNYFSNNNNNSLTRSVANIKSGYSSKNTISGVNNSKSNADVYSNNLMRKETLGNRKDFNSVNKYK